jgi:hypothetical protein
MEWVFVEKLYPLIGTDSEKILYHKYIISQPFVPERISSRQERNLGG